MEIRIASSHADSISASSIYAESWKVAYEDVFSQHTLALITPDFWVKSFDNNYTTNRFKVALISRDNQDIGAGGFGLSRDYDDWGEVTSIYLLPKAWGSGAAKPLMDFMVLQLQNQGFKRIHLWVLSNNQRAIRFYLKYGFTLTGNRRDISFNGETKTEDEFSLFTP